MPPVYKNILYGNELTFRGRIYRKINLHIFELMKQLYLAIKAQLQAKVTAIKFIAMWNNQLMDLEEGKNYSFRLPAVFIEFVSPTQIGGVGNNVQIYEPLEVKLHIVHEQYDAKDGTMDNNLDVFTLKQDVYKAMQLFQAANTSVFDRQSEEQDYDHTNIYHYIQSYFCAMVDNDMPLPIGGTEYEPPLTTEITPEVD